MLGVAMHSPDSSMPKASVRTCECMKSLQDMHSAQKSMIMGAYRRALLALYYRATWLFRENLSWCCLALIEHMVEENQASPQEAHDPGDQGIIKTWNAEGKAKDCDVSLLKACTCEKITK